MMIATSITAAQQGEAALAAVRERAEFEATNRLGDADTAAYEQAHGIAWEPEPTSRPVFAKRKAVNAFDGACIAVNVLVAGVALRFVWDALSMEMRVVLGLLAVWAALMAWIAWARKD